ncbi:MAG TPA: hypothetical protein GXX55_01270 [Firmicutes bacterium]|nr:hypothetical protein [Bacillota bacterium]
MLLQLGVVLDQAMGKTLPVPGGGVLETGLETPVQDAGSPGTVAARPAKIPGEKEGIFTGWAGFARLLLDELAPELRRMSGMGGGREDAPAEEWPKDQPAAGRLAAGESPAGAVAAAFLVNPSPPAAAPVQPGRGRESSPVVSVLASSRSEPVAGVDVERPGAGKKPPLPVAGPGPVGRAVPAGTLEPAFLPASDGEAALPGPPVAPSGPELVPLPGPVPAAGSSLSQRRRGPAGAAASVPMAGTGAPVQSEAPSDTPGPVRRPMPAATVVWPDRRVTSPAGVTTEGRTSPGVAGTGQGAAMVGRDAPVQSQAPSATPGRVRGPTPAATVVWPDRRAASTAGVTTEGRLAPGVAVPPGARVPVELLSDLPEPARSPVPAAATVLSGPPVAEDAAVPAGAPVPLAAPGTVDGEIGETASLPGDSGVPLRGTQVLLAWEPGRSAGPRAVEAGWRWAAASSGPAQAEPEPGTIVPGPSATARESAVTVWGSEATVWGLEATGRGPEATGPGHAMAQPEPETWMPSTQKTAPEVVLRRESAVPGRLVRLPEMVGQMRPFTLDLPMNPGSPGETVGITTREAGRGKDRPSLPVAGTRARADALRYGRAAVPMLGYREGGERRAAGFEAVESIAPEQETASPEVTGTRAARETVFPNEPLRDEPLGVPSPDRSPASAVSATTREKPAVDPLGWVEMRPAALPEPATPGAAGQTPPPAEVLRPAERHAPVERPPAAKLEPGPETPVESENRPALGEPVRAIPKADPPGAARVEEHLAERATVAGSQPAGRVAEVTGGPTPSSNPNGDRSSVEEPDGRGAQLAEPPAEQRGLVTVPQPVSSSARAPERAGTAMVPAAAGGPAEWIEVVEHHRTGEREEQHRPAVETTRSQPRGVDAPSSTVASRPAGGESHVEPVSLSPASEPVQLGVGYKRPDSSTHDSPVALPVAGGLVRQLERIQALEAHRRPGTVYRVNVSMDPPDLGAVEATVAFRHGEIHVRLNVASERGGQALEQEIPLLREALASRGLVVRAIEVAKAAVPSLHPRPETVTPPSAALLASAGGGQEATGHGTGWSTAGWLDGNLSGQAQAGGQGGYWAGAGERWREQVPGEEGPALEPVRRVPHMRRPAGIPRRAVLWLAGAGFDVTV